MRIMVFLLIVGVNVSYAYTTYSQSTKFSLNLKNKTIKEVFSEIEKNSEYIFLYNDENLDETKKVSVDVENQTVDKVLDEVFKNTDNTYYISDRQVFIARVEKSATNRSVEQTQQAPKQQITITGTVVDTDGESLPGVTVKLKSQPLAGVVTNQNGQFSIVVEKRDETLVFSYIGMKTKELKISSATTNYKVVMEVSEAELGMVVVEAGIIQRDKLGFTGSYKTVTREELKAIGNINVIQSLRSLDPSFIIAENNMRGSDPNTMANISLRGGSSMNVTSTFDDLSVNPNQPLFILDGFETDIKVVNDLNINRIESITILKDAGSTAIYGSKGGNGVIVIETVKPKPGQVRLSYDGSMALSNADLSVYNLMNASEKLEFELKAGRFGNINDWIYNTSRAADYYARMKNVQMGVDTYWLKAPLRTGLTQDHSLNIDGGESSFLYQIGAQFRNVEGVMKDSSRKTFGGNIKLQYRKEKFNVHNSLTLSVTNGHNGAWGSFKDFANANPYFKMTNEDGTIPEYLDEFKEWSSPTSESIVARSTAPNPYYNAMLKSRDDTKAISIVNNTSFDWFILPKLRWTNSLQLQTTREEYVNFKDPRHTDYNSVDYTLKGLYKSGKNNDWRYEASSRLVYSLLIQESHNLSFTGRTAIKSIQGDKDAYTVRGFPKGVEGIPTYSYGYQVASRPAYSESVRREANFLLALSYNYQYRYIFDCNLNSDGSTAFGRNKKFQNFWSVGAGWNIDKEPFAQNWKGLDALKLRANYGNNGVQNVNFVSTNVYRYYPGNDIFGASAYLSEFANPNLRWQVVNKTSAGMDGTLLKNRLNVTLDVYQTVTDPLIIDIEQKLSTGVETYPVNLGWLEMKGFEFSTSYQIIKDIQRGIYLSMRVNGITKNSKYGGFAEALNNLNKSYKNEKDASGEKNIREEMNLNSLVQYRDGGSPDDLWAVRSLGIDPSTGREVFLDRFGTPTFEYSADDRVVIASRNPDLSGIAGLTFRYKNLTATCNFRYSLGGYDFNRALFDKVENISNSNIIYNQDRRALYDRWQNVGDISQFKAINFITASGTNATAVSSRFIQRNNYLSGESAQISWDFTKSKWLNTLGLNNLQVNLSYSDLFYISTMKRERGIDYPFARTVNMGVSAQF